MLAKFSIMSVKRKARVTVPLLGDLTPAYILGLIILSTSCTQRGPSAIDHGPSLIESITLNPLLSIARDEGTRQYLAKNGDNISSLNWTNAGDWVAYYRIHLPQLPKGTIKSQTGTDSEARLETGMLSNIDAYSSFKDSRDGIKGEEPDCSYRVELVRSSLGEEYGIVTSRWPVSCDKDIPKSLLQVYPVWSHDSKRIFYANFFSNNDCYIESVNVLNGQRERHMPSSSGLVSVSPDGQYLATLWQDKVFIADASGGGSRYFETGVDVTSPFQVIWTPDSQRVAIPLDKRHQWGILDLRSGTKTVIVDSGSKESIFFAFSPDGNTGYYISFCPAQDEDCGPMELAVCSIDIENRYEKVLFVVPQNSLFLGLCVAPSGNILPLGGLRPLHVLEKDVFLLYWDASGGILSKFEVEDFKVAYEKTTSNHK